MIYTAMVGNNPELFAHVAQMYLKDGDKVADVTYGKGVFWRKIDMSRFDFHPSDVITCPNAPYDFTDLPYQDGSFDVVVFDPPYVHNPGNLIVNPNYLNAETTKGFYHRDIMAYYVYGMAEAVRVLKTDGILMVKCKDEISASLQRWSHIEIAHIADRLDLYCKDLFIMIQKVKPVIQQKQQQHARKNHSYLWILVKSSKLATIRKNLAKDATWIDQAIDKAKGNVS